VINPLARSAAQSPNSRINVATAMGLAALGALITWAFWPTFTSLVHLWNTDDGYSHGYLVPAFSAYLLWSRRDRLPQSWAPRPIIGLTIIVLAWTLRIVAGLRFNIWPEAVALIPFVVGVIVAFGGWPLLRYSWPAIIFLIFMIRLPYRFEVALGAPLQELATIVSTFILQCLGQPALAEGKTILLRDMKLEVVQACSGLKMLFTFIAFSTAVCLLVKKPISDRLVILFSAVPIAIFVNVLRITATGLAYQWWSGDVVHQWSHDLAGWLMMPIALMFLGVELCILKHLISEMPTRVMERRRI
jgi:exosortase